MNVYLCIQYGAPVEETYAPVPYQFAYKAESDEGSHGHSENSDGNGNTQGEYFIKLADGRSRNVRYTADGNGFVAEIETNEPGTESKDAADAKYTSSALTGAEAAAQYTPPAQTTTVQRVKTIHTVAPVVKVVAPAPTVVKTVHTTPVVRTYTATHPVTVVKTAPAIVKTVQTAPVHLAYAHAPVAYSVTHHANEHVVTHH